MKRVMKNFLIVACCVCIVACAKKAVPAKSNTTVLSPGEIYKNDPALHTDSVSSARVFAVIVVADGYGRLITPQKNLPVDENIKYNSLQLSKGFTTQQRANLQARYKTVPPRVLYVAEKYRVNSLKGAYYIYKKKFWYWKKTDGLFYLDQKYYL